MTTSHVLPFNASSLPLRSPSNCSTSFGSSPGWVRPRLNTVTLCPRLRAYRTWNGPVKPVPPRIRMRRLFVLLVVFPIASAAERPDTPGINPKAAAPPAIAESLRNVLRVVDIDFAPCELVGELFGNGWYA